MIDLSRCGVLDDADGDGRAGSDACGDTIRFTLRLDGERVAAVRFGADACPVATAAAGWLAAQAEGGAVLDAARLGTSATAEAIGAAAARRECVALAVDAFHAAIGDAFARGARLARAPQRLAVAMSGGVDSAVVAAETAALEPMIGVTLRLWIDPHGPDPHKACCAPASIRRARDLCHALGVAHITLDQREAFRAGIVAQFVRGYAEGETPNPCVACNGEFRLQALVAFADQAGADTVVTGHYARRVGVDNAVLIGRGADPDKDQSYMLAAVEPAVTRRLSFPLGGRTKADTRARAAALGLEAARVVESQEACFLGGGDYRDFLRRQGVVFTPGPITREDGAVIGRHHGAIGFTPGQRRGLQVSGSEPLYVLRTDPGSHTVVAAPRRRLATDRVALERVVLYTRVDRVEAKLRYRSPGVSARLVRAGGDAALLHLDQPVYGVAPGQTAALYRDGVIVGHGRISAGAAAPPA